MIRTSIAVAAAIVAASSAAAGPREVRLESLDLTAFEQDWGKARADKSVDNHPLSIGGKNFEHGVGTHANSEITIDLGGGAEKFRAMVGVDDEKCGNPGTVVFVVLGDDKELARTPVLKAKDAPHPLDVDLRGVRLLTLIVEDGGDKINCDHADWADAVITMAGASKATPHAAKAVETPIQIAPAPGNAEPRLNYPRIFGASPGKPLLFRIPASGAVQIDSQPLPKGLSIDHQTGVISGTLPAPGRYTFYIGAPNEQTHDTQRFTVVCGPDAVALTPPMGWNSWNCWATAVDDAKVRAAIDAMVSSGLAAHGYRYVNIDDAWEGKRDAEGRIQCNEKFPDMKALADYAHSKGLKLGIYSSPGPKTCAGYEGSYQHELLDAQQYAAWGIDYLKYDWCSYHDIAPKPDHAALMKPYEVMRDALKAQNRDIFFSLCQYGMGSVWEWGAQVGGNCWRTTDDITDTWRSMSSIGFGQAKLAPHAAPGHWNDPDMLVVGKVGWGPSLHDSRLTHNEQITHITLWSMLAAPLLIGCDLTQLDDFTKALLMNDEVLSVNQDEIGTQATRVKQEGQTEVWTRPMFGGAMAVALFNRGRNDAKVSITRSELGVKRTMHVRNAWLRKDAGVLGSELSATIPRHGAALYVLSPQP